MINLFRKKKLPASGQIAVYSVCDNLDYVYKALTTLASVKQFHDDVDIFIVGPLDRTEQKKAAKLCKRFGGKFLHLDLGNDFLEMLMYSGQKGREPSIRLPRNTFWHLYGYKLFSEHGYDYSCHLDGDVLCINPIPFAEAFGGEELLSGVFKNDGEVNSGVMFYDHAKVNSFQFYEKISRYYNQIPIDNPDGPFEYFKKISSYGRDSPVEETQGPWRCYTGDQELLTMSTDDLNLSWNRLPSAFNYLIPRYYEERYLVRNVTIYETLDEVFLAHILHKPWRHRPEMDAYPMLKAALHRWWDFAEEIWTADEIQQHIGTNPLRENNQ